MAEKIIAEILIPDHMLSRRLTIMNTRRNPFNITKKGIKKPSQEYSQVRPFLCCFVFIFMQSKLRIKKITRPVNQISKRTINNSNINRF